MAARLLAYGGTSFSERRRIGQWPAVPEATLRDSYGLGANTWCYGMGVIEAQPFLIFRQRQNVEQRGGYPFSLLLDPGEPVWERFGWNGAALVEALLLESQELLFRTPETCSADALERTVNGVKGASAAANLSPLSYLLAASALEPVLAGSSNRPDPGIFAAALAALPICFRASRGWLVGGGSAHGKALGASLVVDDQISTDTAAGIESGRRLIEAWDSACGQPLVTEPRALASGPGAQPLPHGHGSVASARSLGQLPLWRWEENPQDYLEAILLLRDIQTAHAPNDELIDRAGSARAFQPEIEQAISEMLTRGSGSLGPKASALLIGFVLQKARKMDAGVAGRLDADTVVTELRRFGSPPKRVPKGLPISRDLRFRMWLDYLDQLRSDVRKSLADSLDQLAPVTADERQALVQHALAALPSSDEKLTDWNKFRQDPETWRLLAPSLRAEALRQFQRNAKGAAAAYLLLGDDPGGLLANDARLAAEIKALQKDYPEEVREWLNAMPKVSESRPAREPRVSRREELLEAMRKLLFDSDSGSVEQLAASVAAKFGKQNTPESRADMDEMVTAHCETDGARFAETFADKYFALGDALSFLPASSQDRLIECLRDHNVLDPKARDITFALNNRNSRNAYTRALARAILKDKQLRKRLAMQMGDLPEDVERKLKTMLTQKAGRA